MAGMTQQEGDLRFMQRALKEAREAFDRGEIPIGAIVVAKNRVIARAFNQTEMLNDVTAHAEMLAITAAANQIGGKYLTDCTLYVTVEPCVMCCGAIFWSQLSRVVYAAEDPKRGCSHYAPGYRHPKSQWISGIMADESEALMKEFFLGLRG